MPEGTQPKRTALSAAVATALMTAPVAAQESDDSRGSERTRALEEITVTAQKREQSVQELPMAITAMSGDTMEGLGINNSQELVQHTINLTNRAALGEGARPAYFMRGVGLSDFNTNNSGPVGVYLDEINLMKW